MGEDELKEIEKRREERELAYAEFKGMMNALHLMKLSDTQEAFVKIIEVMMISVKSSNDDLDTLLEGLIHLNQRIKNLEEQVQLTRTTLDTLEENR